jgi:hypothetical protein
MIKVLECSFVSVKGCTCMLQLFENEQFWLDSKQSIADLDLILYVFTVSVHINNFFLQKYIFWFISH